MIVAPSIWKHESVCGECACVRSVPCREDGYAKGSGWNATIAGRYVAQRLNDCPLCYDGGPAVRTVTEEAQLCPRLFSGAQIPPSSKGLCVVQTDGRVWPACIHFDFFATPNRSCGGSQRHGSESRTRVYLSWTTATFSLRILCCGVAQTPAPWDCVPGQTRGNGKDEIHEAATQRLATTHVLNWRHTNQEWSVGDNAEPLAVQWYRLTALFTKLDAPHVDAGWATEQNVFALDPPCRKIVRVALSCVVRSLCCGPAGRQSCEP